MLYVTCLGIGAAFMVLAHRRAEAIRLRVEQQGACDAPDPLAWDDLQRETC